jgi:hypothetical protein
MRPATALLLSLLLTACGQDPPASTPSDAEAPDASPDTAPSADMGRIEDMQASDDIGVDTGPPPEHLPRNVAPLDRVFVDDLDIGAFLLRVRPDVPEGLPCAITYPSGKRATLGYDGNGRLSLIDHGDWFTFRIWSGSLPIAHVDVIRAATSASGVDEMERVTTFLHTPDTWPREVVTWERMACSEDADCAAEGFVCAAGHCALSCATNEQCKPLSCRPIDSKSVCAYESRDILPLVSVGVQTRVYDWPTWEQTDQQGMSDLVIARSSGSWKTQENTLTITEARRTSTFTLLATPPLWHLANFGWLEYFEFEGTPSVLEVEEPDGVYTTTFAFDAMLRMTDVTTTAGDATPEVLTYEYVCQ